MIAYVSDHQCNVDNKRQILSAFLLENPLTVATLALHIHNRPTFLEADVQGVENLSFRFGSADRVQTYTLVTVKEQLSQSHTQNLYCNGSDLPTAL